MVVVEAPCTLPSTSRPTRTTSDARDVQVLLEAYSQATTLETHGFFLLPHQTINSSQVHIGITADFSSLSISSGGHASVIHAARHPRQITLQLSSHFTSFSLLHICLDIIHNSQCLAFPPVLLQYHNQIQPGNTTPSEEPCSAGNIEYNEIEPVTGGVVGVGFGERRRLSSRSTIRHSPYKPTIIAWLLPSFIVPRPLDPNPAIRVYIVDLTGIPACRAFAENVLEQLHGAEAEPARNFDEVLLNGGREHEERTSMRSMFVRQTIAGVYPAWYGSCSLFGFFDVDFIFELFTPLLLVEFVFDSRSVEFNFGFCYVAFNSFPIRGLRSLSRQPTSYTHTHTHEMSAHALLGGSGRTYDMGVDGDYVDIVDGDFASGYADLASVDDTNIGRKYDTDYEVMPFKRV
ncbi:hypothetical protein K443DRAFT_9483 [Laccaria amethystina LaAM-08-1]|uniref:Uncharacterized protein n=1 Tax=Laccaria amethystina LaAM-08-1 TaxID=1095629 RepID=A0A0C9WYY9_9AGAR|nr:hypothetical protein K443DRAFT_9483 [Laccaria amethystina LaAM-08-1]